MNADLTRRILLKLAGASSLAAAAAGAVRAEGGTPGAATPQALLAHRTPMRIGAAALRVRDLDVMTAYYRDAIGLAVIGREPGLAHLGAGGVRLLTLEQRLQAAFEARGTAGLFHTAFLMPTRKDLARWLVHAARNHVPLTGFADHLVSEAVYLDDPEGNGIEVYSDRAPESWTWADGAVTMATNQLDIDGLVSLTNIQVSDYAAAPEGLRIGHMHLRVGDLARADAFYREAVGLDLTRQRNGASFLSSGRYHHHLGMNIWQSAGAGRRDDAATGLAWFSLEVGTGEILEAQQERLKRAGAEITTLAKGIEAVDPWGTRLRIERF
jgi:catechol 2,3-dioxygenase